MENLRTDCCCKNYYRAITFIMADSERGVLIGSLWSETEDLSSVLICWGISQHTYCCAYRLIILLVVLSLIQSGVYSSDHRTKRMPLSMQAGRAQCFYACEPIPNRRSALLLTDCHYTEHRHRHKYFTCAPSVCGNLSAVQRVPNEGDRLRVASKTQLNCDHLLRDPISR